MGEEEKERPADRRKVPVGGRRGRGGWWAKCQLVGGVGLGENHDVWTSSDPGGRPSAGRAGSVWRVCRWNRGAPGEARPPVGDRRKMAAAATAPSAMASAYPVGGGCRQDRGAKCQLVGEVPVGGRKSLEIFAVLVVWLARRGVAHFGARSRPLVAIAVSPEPKPLTLAVGSK